MVIDIKMCRFENVPWGFRLVGGADFEFPLTVVKVNEGSIAEEAGMREGDVIVRINDTATSPLSHDEADKVIRHCGNVFYIGVQREGEDELVPKMFPVLGLERSPTPQDFLDVSGRKSPLPRQLEDSAESPTEYLSDLPERPSSVLSEQTEIKLVEEEIAAVLSGESEVLKEHNVIGIFPKPGVCMTSDVLRTLNADATKTKAEKDKENKKWSTFLVKPDRPVPKSKEQIEAERRAANAYKVKIVVSRSRSPSPMPQPPEAIHPVETKPSTVIEKQPSPPKFEEVEEPPPKDSELPNLEEVKIVVEPPAEENEQPQVEVENQLKTMEDSIVESKEEVQETKRELSPPNETTAPPPSAVEQSAEESATTKTTNASAEPNVPELQQREKTEEELALERQLADVQRQLAALSSLPSTIQATLDSVTKQLATLLPAFQLQTVTTQAQRVDTSVAAETRSISLEKIEEITEVTKTQEAPNPDSTCTKGDIVTTEPVTVEAKENANTAVSALDDVKKQEARQNKEDMQIMEEEQNAKKQKRNDVIEELEEQLERKNNPRRSKRAFGPLTPSSERPLVLPGGRRWYRPKDAYNDEFIAETLSAQAELITGTTLGCTFESPLLGYDPRVNFMKYQKPEKKIDLNRSEVYKVIHHLDRQPVRGIEVRPPVVPAEVDIRKVALQP